MRVGELPEWVALRRAQTDIGKDRYYGSGLLAYEVATQTGNGDVRVLANDPCQARRERLGESGLSMLDEEFPGIGHDAYKAFEEIVGHGELDEDDLVLIDPFGEFLPSRASEVIPRMAEAAEPRKYLERRLKKLATHLADIVACQLEPRAARGI